MALLKLGAAAAVAAAGVAYVGKDWAHDLLGLGRTIEPLNNSKCTQIPELPACEDTWLHESSGHLYLACSSPWGRVHWLPNDARLNVDKRPLDDFFAVVDTRGDGPLETRIKKLRLDPAFAATSPTGRGDINLHGFGVYELPSDGTGQAARLRLFAINHRPPLTSDAASSSSVQAEASRNGANSTIELFETEVGSDLLRHVRTYASPVIRTPNNLAAAGPDSFVFSNDNAYKVGHRKSLELVRAGSDIGFCDEHGCRRAMYPVQYPNGVAAVPRAEGGAKQFAIATVSALELKITELQADGSLVLLDRLRLQYPVDNINYAADGTLYLAALPKAGEVIGKVLRDPLHLTTPSTVLKVEKNEGRDKFFGHKYRVTKVFEDDGSIASSITSASFDALTNRLWLGSLSAPYSVVCDLNG